MMRRLVGGLVVVALLAAAGAWGWKEAARRRVDEWIATNASQAGVSVSYEQLRAAPWRPLTLEGVVIRPQDTGEETRIDRVVIERMDWAHKPMRWVKLRLDGVSVPQMPERVRVALQRDLVYQEEVNLRGAATLDYELDPTARRVEFRNSCAEIEGLLTVCVDLVGEGVEVDDTGVVKDMKILQRLRVTIQDHGFVDRWIASIGSKFDMKPEKVVTTLRAQWVENIGRLLPAQYRESSVEALGAFVAGKAKSIAIVVGRPGGVNFDDEIFGFSEKTREALENGTYLPKLFETLGLRIEKS